MRHAAFAILVFLVTGAGSFNARAFEAATPTDSQVERCRQAGEFEKFCLSGYVVSGLKLPSEAVTLGPLSSTGKMAIYKPDGPGPFPALIIMHSCGAIVPEQTGYWVKSALANGYVAFILDSWSQRGLPNGSCDVSPGFNSITVRVRDAYDALARLAEIPAIDVTRVAAIGFSHGGRVAYLLSNSNLARMFGRRDIHFAANVSVYGECYNRPTKSAYLRGPIETPLLALLGDRDEDGDIRECEPRLKELQASGSPVEWHVFAGAGHAWDQPNFQSATMRPYPGSTSGSVLYKYDAKVTDETRARAFAFLNGRLKP